MAGELTVLLADDHSVLRAGLQRLLDAVGFRVVAECGGGEQACELYAEHHPDVLVMDLSMPGVGGLEALRRLIALHPQARVVVYTMHESPSIAAHAMRAGARGYVGKSGDVEDLVTAVRQVAVGHYYISPQLAQHVARPAAAGRDEPLARLSMREIEIFRLLAEGYGVEAIADALQISPKTVANHQTLLKHKLDISNAVELVHLAIRYGVIPGARVD